MKNNRIKFHCEKCNYTCYTKQNWNKHLSTKKHNSAEKEDKYICNLCDYICYKKSLFTQHLQTKKHTMNMNIKKQEKDYKNNNSINNNCKNNIEDNNKINNCKNNIEVNNKINNINNNDTLSFMISEMIEHKKCLEQIMKTQNSTNEKLYQLSNEPKVINNIYNNTKINNTFNLHNFLQVDCNDALNFKDFIFSLQIGRNDLEFLQKNGYIKSYENVIVKQLENMEQTKRPLHCLDQKRKKFILKDKDNWTKENIEKTLRLSIDHFCNLLLCEYNKWKDDHPDWKENTDDELFDIGLHLSNEILSPYNEKKMPKIEAVVLQNMLNFTIEKNKK
jgi:hypothetical protein